MKKQATMMSALLAAAMLISSCSGQPSTSSSSTPSNSSNSESSTSSSSTSSETSSEPEEEIPDFKGVRVAFGNWGDANWSKPGDDEEGLREAAWRTEMEEKYNFKLEYVSLPTEEYMPMIITSGVAGDPIADIYSLMLDNMPGLMAKNLLHPLDEIKSWDMVTGEGMLSSVAEATTWSDGHVYGFYRVGGGAPYLGSKIFTVYNKQMAESLGLDLNADYASGDWTWDRFRECAALATKDTNNDGINETWGYTADVNLLGLGYIGSTGSVMLNANNELNYHEPGTLAGLAEYGKVKEYCNVTPEGANWDFYMTEFAKGNTLFGAANQWWMLSRYQEMEADFGILPFPLPKKGDPMHVVSDIDGVQSIAKGAKDPEAAAFVLKLFAGPRPWDYDEDGNLIEEDKSDPTWFYKFYESQVRDEESLKCLTDVMTCENFTFDRQRMFNVYWNNPGFSNMLEQVWKGTMTPEQAVQANEKPAQDLLKTTLDEYANAAQ